MPKRDYASSDMNACMSAMLGSRRPPMMKFSFGGQDAIVVTLDADFHAILATSAARGPSVIRLRMQGLRAPEVVALVQRVLAGFEADLKHGCLITLKAHKITCHRLPIGHRD